MKEFILFSDRMAIVEGYEKWLSEIPEANLKSFLTASWKPASTAGEPVVPYGKV